MAAVSRIKTTVELSTHWVMIQHAVIGSVGQRYNRELILPNTNVEKIVAPLMHMVYDGWGYIKPNSPHTALGLNKNLPDAFHPLVLSFNGLGPRYYLPKRLYKPIGQA